MNHTSHNKLISFIWSIVDNRLHDICLRGKYRDFILPMVVVRRFDIAIDGHTFLLTRNEAVSLQALIVEKKI